MDTSTASRTAWQRALHDPQLQDLPYTIETNEYGQLVLSPHKPRHSLLQSEIYDRLRALVDRPGRPTTEFAVETSAGVKVPDVVWISDERLAQIPDDAAASPVMPELCIEVLFESNTADEMAEKRTLYFDAGAQEVWTCDAEGQVVFYDADGRRDASAFAPDFPSSVSKP